MSAVGKLGHGKVIHGEKAQLGTTAGCLNSQAGFCWMSLSGCFPICRSLSIHSFTCYIFNKLTHSKQKGRLSETTLWNVQNKANRKWSSLQRKPHLSETMSPWNWGRETESLSMTTTGKVLGGSRWVAAGGPLNRSPPKFTQIRIWPLTPISSMWGGGNPELSNTKLSICTAVNPKSSEPYLTLHAYKAGWGFRANHTNAVFSNH